PTTARATVPLTRGGGGTSASSGGTTKETYSAAGTRISDKLDALVEDYARWMQALRAGDGTYSFDDARTKDKPEAQLLYAFDRLAESARVLRGALPADVSRRAVRELTNGVPIANRILPSTRIPAEFTQRWQDIQREINQFAGAAAGGK
ncbi:MAG: hypothetical protein HYR56_34435, partial [Acidobacteria bacterium]|nr:hypothetical protein [Acidobacteriota bacterium]